MARCRKHAFHDNVKVAYVHTSQNDFQIASRMYEQLIDPESLHSISWTKECKTGLGGTEGRDELMKICKPP
jgi:hypothetical protein